MGKYKDRVEEDVSLEQNVNTHKSIRDRLKSLQAEKTSLRNQINDLQSNVSSDGDDEDIAEVNKLDTLYQTIFKNGNGQTVPK